MYPAHRAHIAFCVLPTFKTTGRTGISRSHIYSKGAPPPKTPGLQGARQRASDRWYAPPAACSLEHPRPLPVNPYSRLTAAVNQIIPYFPMGFRPWGNRPIFLTAAPAPHNNMASAKALRQRRRLAGAGLSLHPCPAICPGTSRVGAPVEQSARCVPGRYPPMST